MSGNKSVRSERTKNGKSTARQDKSERSAKYNYTRMKDETVLAAEGFAARLTQLRTAKNVSAREMSLSLGQAAGYINSIENGNGLPSMSMFFEICEYLEVSAEDYFAYVGSKGMASLIEAISGLSIEDQSLILALVERIRGKR